MYQMLIGNKIWEKLVHHWKSHHKYYFLLWYVQCLMEFIVLKINVSCWSHSFLQLIHQYFLLKKWKYLFWKIINDLHAWIKNHPHVIHPPNVKDSVFVKISGTMVKKTPIYFKSQEESYTMTWYYQVLKRVFRCNNNWWKYLYRTEVT